MYGRNQAFAFVYSYALGAVRRHNNNNDANSLMQYFGKTAPEPENDDMLCIMNM
jgi:hypothetical protein